MLYWDLLCFVTKISYTSLRSPQHDLSNHKIVGEEVVTAVGEEVDRLEKEIQRLVPGIRHVDIEVHNPSSFQETPAYM